MRSFCLNARSCFVKLGEGGDGKSRETFPHIPDEPSKL